MKIGYARVSSIDQNLDSQLQALKAEGCKRIYQEKVSGVKKHRPELEKLLEQLREKDTVVISRLDRLARSTRHLLEIAERIEKSDAHFYSLAEPWANTTCHTGRMLLTVFAGIAEFERDLIRERTKSGRIAARSRGVKFGRPQKIKNEQRNLIDHLLEQGKSVNEIALTFSIHPSTVYRALAARNLP